MVRRSPGIVRKLNVTVGSHIQKGDIIAEIDPRPLQARVEQARTQAAMDEVGVGKAQRDLNRGQQLFSEGVLPAQQKEDLEWQMKSAQAKLEKSKSDLAAAEIDLSYAVIRAPISGTVASVSTQEGETVAASFAAPTFVTIIEDNALELVAMVDETDIAQCAAWRDGGLYCGGVSIERNAGDREADRSCRDDYFRRCELSSDGGYTERWTAAQAGYDGEYHDQDGGAEGIGRAK